MSLPTPSSDIASPGERTERTPESKWLQAMFVCPGA